MEILKDYSRYFGFNKWIFFFVLCLFYSLNTFVFNEVLITKEIYYQTFGEQVALDRIDELFEFREKWKWIGYVIVPLMLLFKISLVAVSLNIGTLFAGYKIGYKKLFQIAMIAETVFLTGALSKTLYLVLFKEVRVMQDIQYFYPFSLLGFFDDPQKTIERYLIYPLQTINLYEITYFLSLALGLHWVLKKPYKTTFVLTVASYGIGLLIWMVLIVFMSINMS